MKGYLPIAKEFLTEKEILSLNPLVLAFVGDSVQQLMVRTKLASTSTAKAGELHKLQSEQIKASAQAKYMDEIMSILTEEEIAKLRAQVAKLKVEGDLRREVALNIKRLMEIGSYRGIRHRKGLPVRGQKTKTNARTRKGKARPIAGKKK